MAKVIACKGMGADCDFVARGETEDELFQSAAAHGAAVHDDGAAALGNRVGPYPHPRRVTASKARILLPDRPI